MPDTADAPDTDKAVWRERGAPLVAPARTGPLSGLRLAVKDIYAVAGHRIGAGNPAWLDEAEPETAHARAVRALLDAGAEVTGIAQTDELAYSLDGTNAHYGTPPNPAAPGRIPGGSSSGPAAAVALGEADAGLCSDTAGSVRVPSSYCGLYGMRPTHGAVPVTGMLPLAPDFDTVAWLARDAGTLARIGDALLPGAGRPQERPVPEPEGTDAGEPSAPGVPDARLPFRTALLSDELLAPVAAEIRGIFGLTAAELTARAGLRTTAGPPLEGDPAKRAAAFSLVQGAQVWEGDGSWVSAHPRALGPRIADRFAWASRIAPHERERAGELVRATARTLHTALSPDTVLLLPAAPGPAPAADSAAEVTDSVRRSALQLTCLASLAGLPALVLPLMTTAEGLPVGMCVLAAPGRDRALLALGRALDGHEQGARRGPG